MKMKWCFPCLYVFVYTERQAQDLGLHRAEVVKQNIEMRRRLWGACLISDRWYCT